MTGTEKLKPGTTCWLYGSTRELNCTKLHMKPSSEVLAWPSHLQQTQRLLMLHRDSNNGPPSILLDMLVSLTNTLRISSNIVALVALAQFFPTFLISMTQVRQHRHSLPSPS